MARFVLLKMGLFLCISLLAFCTAGSAIQFINPPPFETTNDFSLNTVFVEGSVMNIQWTAGPPENGTSLTLFQLNGTQFLFPFEYLTQNVDPSVTSLNWVVQTSKDLSVSNMFYLCIFLSGATTSENNSHYFNITAKEVVNAGSSSSSRTITSTTTSSTSTQLSLSTAPGSATTLPNATNSAPGSRSTGPTAVPTVATSSAGLSIMAKAGIGIGMSAAVVLGIVNGWFIFGRRKKQDAHVSMNPARQGNPALSELSYDSDKHVQRYQLSSEQRYQLSGESMVVPWIHELPEGHRRSDMI